jgi:hypothetical protein
MRPRASILAAGLLLSCGPADSPGPRAASSPTERESETPAAASTVAGEALQTEDRRLETGDSDGEARSAELVQAEESGPRIAATGPHVQIMVNASSKGLALGNVRMGTSVRLLSPDPIAGEGCARGWYAIVPRGYVCLGPRTTLDLSDPYYRALHELAPNRGELYPYHYAYSRGAPMYSRVPTPAEWQESEMKYGPAGSWEELGDWAKGHEELLASGPIVATDPVPWFFEGGERRVGGATRSVLALVWKTIPNGSMLAYARAFEMHGRVWLVTPDLTIVPADRVQPIRHHEFRGVEIGNGVELPLAWNRTHDPRPLYRREGDGFVANGETIAGKRWAMVKEQPAGGANDSYYELKERAGVFVRGKEVTLSTQRPSLPPAIKPDQKWLDAHITPGTLTVYVGLKPVYATLFSPGKGGHPVPGHDHSKFATTQTGVFRLEWKEAVATMSNESGEPKVLWFSDVPNVQYVKAPLAMHVSYWHEDFGNPKSAECVNLSAWDGRWMFEWTDPKLPEEWGAVRPGDGFGPSTAIVINGF